MPVRQTELERGILGVLLGVALGALVGLLAKEEDGETWDARSKT
jgi:gas vesicle protein